MRARVGWLHVCVVWVLPGVVSLCVGVHVCGCCLIQTVCVLKHKHLGVKKGVEVTCTRENKALSKGRENPCGIMFQKCLWCVNKPLIACDGHLVPSRAWSICVYVSVFYFYFFKKTFGKMLNITC